jgi:hypothetical protein
LDRLFKKHQRQGRASRYCNTHPVNDSTTLNQACAAICNSTRNFNDSTRRYYMRAPPSAIPAIQHAPVQTAGDAGARGAAVRRRRLRVRRRRVRLGVAGVVRQAACKSGTNCIAVHFFCYTYLDNGAHILRKVRKFCRTRAHNLPPHIVYNFARALKAAALVQTHGPAARARRLVTPCHTTMKRRKTARVRARI